MTEQNNVVLSLGDAAHHLQNLMMMIGEGHEIDQYLADHYKWVDDQATNSIDRRKYLLREIQAKMDVLQRMKAEIYGYMKRLNKTEESIRESTKAIMEFNPNISIRDSYGVKLSLCEHPGKVELQITTSNQTLKYTLTDEQIEDLYIHGYDVYCKVVNHTVLDIDKIRKDLDDGAMLPGLAAMVRTTYLRGL